MSIDDRDEALEPEDKRLWDRLAQRLARVDPGGVPLGRETAAALDQACPAATVSAGLRSRLDRIFERAFADLAFEQAMQAKRRRPSLGGYLAFLRGQAGLSVSEAAKKYGVDFQLLADLERDGLPPGKIPGRKLAGLVRRLKGSLEQTEALLWTTVRAPRYITAGTRDSLYRKTSGVRRAPEVTTGEQRENPEYGEEREAVARLLQEVRDAWGKG